MPLKDLTHLRADSFSITPLPEIQIFHNPAENREDLISIKMRIRAAESPSLRYEITTTEMSRLDLIDSLRQAINTLVDLPNESTLEGIAEAMGTTLDDLEC